MLANKIPAHQHPHPHPHAYVYSHRPTHTHAHTRNNKSWPPICVAILKNWAKRLYRIMRITNQNECAQHVCLICAFSWADSFPICFRSHLMPCRQIYYIPTIQKSVKTHSTSSLSYKDSHQNFLFFTSTAHEIPNNGKVLLSDFSFKNTLCFSIISVHGFVIFFFF